MDIVERIGELIKKENKSVNAILMDCRLPHSAWAAWKNGRAKPSLEAIIKLANYFNVTTDYLLGLEQYTEPEYPPIINKLAKLYETNYSELEEVIEDAITISEAIIDASKKQISYGYIAPSLLHIAQITPVDENTKQGSKVSFSSNGGVRCREGMLISSFAIKKDD